EPCGVLAFGGGGAAPDHTDARGGDAVVAAGGPAGGAAAPAPRRAPGRMHAVDRALQDAEENEWRRTNPEARARAEGLTGQLQAAVDKLRAQIEQARTAGNSSKAEKLERELEGRQALLDQALKGLQEFGG
ncbi:hypothetical protein ACFV3F_35890, partial [Streptomyces sp. NPDC059717]